MEHSDRFKWLIKKSRTEYIIIKSRSKGPSVQFWLFYNIYYKLMFKDTLFTRAVNRLFLQNVLLTWITCCFDLQGTPVSFKRKHEWTECKKKEFRGSCGKCGKALTNKLEIHLWIWQAGFKTADNKARHYTIKKCDNTLNRHQCHRLKRCIKKCHQRPLKALRIGLNFCFCSTTPTGEQRKKFLQTKKKSTL